MIFEVECDTTKRRTHGPDAHTYCLFYCIRLCVVLKAVPGTLANGCSAWEWEYLFLLIPSLTVNCLRYLGFFVLSLRVLRCTMILGNNHEHEEIFFSEIFSQKYF